MASGGQQEGNLPENVEFNIKRPTTIKMGDLEKLLDKRFAVLATAAQIDKMGERIGRNEHDITIIKGELQKLKKKITDHQEKPAAAQRVPISSPPRHNSLSSMKEASFLRSHKSLRIWPIDGQTTGWMREELEKFMKDALRITPNNVDGIVIDDI